MNDSKFAGGSPRRPARRIARVAFAGIALMIGVGALFLLSPFTTRSSRAALSHMVDRAAAAHPNALWHVVHDLCVPAMRTTGRPSPCTTVDLDRGYAVLSDVPGTTQLLVTPTTRVIGIESPDLQAAGSPNYWLAAWSSRGLIEARTHVAIPRDDLGLAVNSAYARTQEQLHIHVDCIQPSVKAALAMNIREVHEAWSPFPVKLAGHRFKALWLAGDDLGRTDPFKLLAANDKDARTDMRRETLVVIGSSGPHGEPGFVALSRSANPAVKDWGIGEELLDHKCKLVAHAKGS